MKTLPVVKTVKSCTRRKSLNPHWSYIRSIEEPWVGRVLFVNTTHSGEAGVYESYDSNQVVILDALYQADFDYFALLLPGTIPHILSSTLGRFRRLHIANVNWKNGNIIITQINPHGWWRSTMTTIRHHTGITHDLRRWRLGCPPPSSLTVNSTTL